MLQGEHFDSLRLNIPLFSLNPSNESPIILFSLKAQEKTDKHILLHDSISSLGVTCMVSRFCVVSPQLQAAGHKTIEIINNYEILTSVS